VRAAATSKSRLDLIGRELLAALNGLPLMLPMAAAAGVIAYGPLGPDYAMRAAVAGLACAATGGLVAALVRGPSGLVMAPTNPFAAAQAGVLGTIMGALGPPNDLQVAALPLLVLLTGLVQVALGAIDAPRLVKFVPYPVISGFVSGIGVLLLLKFAPAILGAASPRQLWDAAFGGPAPNLMLAVFTVLVVGLAFGVRALAPGAPTILIAFLAGIAGYHVAGIYGYAAGLGPTLGADALHQLWTAPFAAAQWLLQAGLAPLLPNAQAWAAIGLGAVILAVIGLLDTVLATRAAQGIADFPARPRRDMLGLGAGNVVCALVGAVPLSTSASQTRANYHAGGRSRLSVLTLLVALLALLLVFPGAIGAIPLCALPPVIILTGWLIIDPYSASIVRRSFAPPSVTRAQARRNALIHFSVLLPTAMNQPLIGVGVGIVLSCVVFIISMSRPIIRSEQDGRALTSKRIRTRMESEVLANHGTAIVVFDLEGPLFFGNAEDLARAIKAKEQARVVVLSFRGVTDIDATGLKIIEQAKRMLMLTGRRLVVARVPPAIDAAVREICDTGDCFRDVDEALEFAENMLIRQQAEAAAPGGKRADGALLDVSDFDLCEGASSAQLATLASLLQKESLPAAATLCREGDLADRMWMIRSGAVSVRVGNGVRGLRIAAFGAGTTIGEMAMIEDKPRSASVVVDEPVELYVLTRDAYGTILAEHPDIASVFFQNVSRDLSRRLRVSSADLYAALN
jgi:SulP family sulfate permease